MVLKLKFRTNRLMQLNSMGILLLAILLCLLASFTSQSGSSFTIQSRRRWSCRRISLISKLAPSSNNNNNKKDTAPAVDALLNKAAQLRKEIEGFEAEKQALEEKEVAQVRAEKAEEQAVREKFSAVLPILKPDGTVVEERVDFPAKLNNTASSIMKFQSNLPLGILLGEDTENGSIVIDELAGGVSPIGLMVGDVLRACSACKMEMTTPTWQLLAGGIGVPKTKRLMYAADDRPLEEVMEAIGSNRMDPDGRPVILVIERPE